MTDDEPSAYEDLGASQPRRAASAVFACGHPEPQGVRPPPGLFCPECRAAAAQFSSARKASVRRALKQNPPRDAIDKEFALRDLVDSGHAPADAQAFLTAITKNTTSTRRSKKR